MSRQDGTHSAQGTQFAAVFPPGKQGFVCGTDYWIGQSDSRSEVFRIDVRPTANLEITSLTYHYPDYTGNIVKNPHALQDTAAFFDRIRGRKQVKAYVFGHSHVWKRLRKNDIHLVNLPTTAWRFDPSQPYAWVLARLRDNGMDLTLRSIDPEHPKHDEVVKLDWR